MYDADDDGRFTVILGDRVPVRISTSLRGRVVWRDGILFGGWYVWRPDFNDIGATADECWTAGHVGTGMAVQQNLEFADAVRVARACEDAFADGEIVPDDEEFTCLFQAVVGAALADHYVFPIDRWLLGEYEVGVVYDER